MPAACGSPPPAAPTTFALWQVADVFRYGEAHANRSTFTQSNLGAYQAKPP